MFFLIIIAALLYVYRYFRKTGAAVSSRYVEPGSGPTSLPRVSGPLEKRLAASDVARTVLWDGEKRITNGELLQLVRRVARAAGADGTPRGVPVVLQQAAAATPLALAVAALAGLHLHEAGMAAGGRAVTGAQVRRWLEAEPSEAEAVGEDAGEVAELEAALEGLAMGPRDSVRHAARPVGRAARRVLRWQAGGGGGAAGMLGREQPAAAEASVLLLTRPELEAGVARMRRALEQGGLLRRWAMQQALALAGSGPATSLWARCYVQTKLIIADTLYFPAAVAAGFGPRAAHLLVAREDGPVEPATMALLRAFNVEIHVV